MRKTILAFALLATMPAQAQAMTALEKSNAIGTAVMVGALHMIDVYCHRVQEGSLADIEYRNMRALGVSEAAFVAAPPATP